MPRIRSEGALAGLVVVVSGCLLGCGSDDPRQADREAVLGSEDQTPGVSTTRRSRPSGVTRSRLARPRVEQWRIPFPAARRRDTAKYTRRHYGKAEVDLDPQVIVEHYTVTETAQEAYDIFARNEPDVELHDLPGLCTHFLVDRDGMTYQLVSLKLICRHTVGLNDVAIGIEHVGGSDWDVLEDRPQLEAFSVSPLGFGVKGQ